MIVDNERVRVLDLAVLMRMTVRLVADVPIVLMRMMRTMRMLVLMRDMVVLMRQLFRFLPRPDHGREDREYHDAATQP